MDDQSLGNKVIGIREIDLPCFVMNAHQRASRKSVITVNDNSIGRQGKANKI